MLILEIFLLQIFIVFIADCKKIENQRGNNLQQIPEIFYIVVDRPVEFERALQEQMQL